MDDYKLRTIVRNERSKNWLSAEKIGCSQKVKKDAQATGIILSILRTAVENGLGPRKYLICLFEKIPNLPSLTKTALVAYLFSDQEIQNKCQTNYEYKKTNPSFILKYTIRLMGF